MPYEFEYASEFDVRREILAGDSGRDPWEPWRVDAAGTSWYRRVIGVPAEPHCEFIDADEEEQVEAEVEDRILAAEELLQNYQPDGRDVE
jgi:hypothetical protein